MQVAQALEEFLLAKESEGRANATLVKYEQQVQAFAAVVGTKGVSEITAHDIRAFLAGLRRRELKPSSCNTYYRSLHAFLYWCAAEYGILSPNPIDRVEPPGVPKRIPPSLSDDGFYQMLSACSKSRQAERDRAILLVLLDTGLRAGELVGLKISDLDLREGEIKCFGKDQEERFVPLERGAVRALNKYFAVRKSCKSDDPRFPSARGPGCHLTESALLRVIKRLAKRAGLEENAYPHLFRHTFAKKWLRGPGKGDIEALRDIMGHSSVSTTRIYAAYEFEDIKEMHRERSPVNQLLESRDRPSQLSFW